MLKFSKAIRLQNVRSMSYWEKFPTKFFIDEDKGELFFKMNVRIPNQRISAVHNGLVIILVPASNDTSKCPRIRKDLKCTYLNLNKFGWFRDQAREASGPIDREESIKYLLRLHDKDTIKTAFEKLSIELAKAQELLPEPIIPREEPEDCDEWIIKPSWDVKHK